MCITINYRDVKIILKIKYKIGTLAFEQNMLL